MIKKWWLTVFISLAVSLGAGGVGAPVHAAEPEAPAPTSLTATGSPAADNAATLTVPPNLTLPTASDPTVALPVMAAPPVTPTRAQTSLLASPAAPSQLTTDSPADDQPTPAAPVQPVPSAPSPAQETTKPRAPRRALRLAPQVTPPAAVPVFALPLANRDAPVPQVRHSLAPSAPRNRRLNIAQSPVSAPALTRQLPLHSAPPAPPHDHPRWQWGVIGSLVVLIGLLGGQIARRRYPKVPHSK